MTVSEFIFELFVVIRNELFCFFSFLHETAACNMFFAFKSPHDVDFLDDKERQADRQTEERQTEERQRQRERV